MELATFMFFWLSSCDQYHIERIPTAVKNIDHLFHLASEIIKVDRLHLFSLPDGTRIYDNEYLESLKSGTELIVCTKEQMQKLSIYFEIKRYVCLKNIDYPLNIDYLMWRLASFRVNALFKITFIEAVISSNKSCSKCFLIVFTYDFEQTKRVRNKWGADKLIFHHKQFMIVFGRI